MSALARRESEADTVFDKALAVIHSSLVLNYRLLEDEAAEVERDLRTWFRRLVRRRGGEQTPVKTLRASLFSATCEYGRSFWIRKLGGRPTPDGTLEGLLIREPEEVALDLERRLDGED